MYKGEFITGSEWIDYQDVLNKVLSKIPKDKLQFVKLNSNRDMLFVWYEDDRVEV